MIVINDPPRVDTKEVIEKAIKLGIQVKMITGDQIAIAKETCKMINLGTNIYTANHLRNPNNKDICLKADGFAEVFPEHKYQIVDLIMQSGFKVGMTGDGINDAPALKKATVGIAVQGATDAARAASDIILVDPGLSTIIDAIIISRKIFQRMRN